MYYFATFLKILHYFKIECFLKKEEEWEYASCLATKCVYDNTHLGPHKPDPTKKCCTSLYFQIIVALSLKLLKYRKFILLPYSTKYLWESSTNLS